MINHHVLNVVNEARNKYAKVEQLMGVTAHIECAWFASLRYSSHIEAAA